jgi:DNA (cytosine-5)-methyltransferase 1
MKHFDLFSGYGGLSLALEKVYGDLQNIPNSKEQQHETEGSISQSSGVDINTEVRLGNTFETIGFSEIDKYASAVLKYHWPNIKNYGDITKIDWAKVPDFDLLTGGSPCQDLSIAGKRAGLTGSRSGLFYEYMRAVKEKQPKYFIWENVKGALSSNKGFDFAAVLNEMAETGYNLWWQILNAKDFNIPQNRERIFVVGFRDGSPREIFFEPKNDRLFNQENEPDGRSSQATVCGTLKSSGAVKADDTFVRIPEATRKGFAVAGGGDSINLSQINSKTRRGRVGHGIAQTLDTGMQQHTLTKSRIRRLTPTECERLMGLPDDWTSKGIIDRGVMGNVNVLEETEISDSQRYKLCGNGVVVNVVEELIKTLILSEATEKPSYGNNNLTT